MKIKDQFAYALHAMTDRRLRTTLTIIGIIIGPATIVSLIAATQGYSNASTAQFDKLGATTLFVSPAGRGFSLTQSDLSSIQDLSGVSAVVPYQELSGTISQGGESVAVEIVAADLSQLNTVFPSLSVEEGSVPSSTDLSSAIVGHSIAFPDISGATNLTVDQILTVSGVGRGFTFGVQSGSLESATSSSKSFVVTGVFNAFGQGFFLNPDTAVFVPLAEGEAILHSYSYTGIMVVASSTGLVSQVTTELTALYGNDVRVTSVSSILSTITSVTQSTGTLLEAVGSISVVVAFIAIMTTEFTSVLERTKEIGILKALGATARTIMFNFISESLAVGFLGGVIGAAIGSGLSFFIIGLLAKSSSVTRGTTGVAAPTGSFSVGRGGGGGGASFVSSFGSSSSAAASTTVKIIPALTPELILLAIALATVVGGLAGVLPAWRASRLTPVEALRTT